MKFGEDGEGWGYQLLGDDNGTYYGEVSIVPGAGLPQRVAYAVEDGTTLTFYCDANKATHTTGTVYGIHDKRENADQVPAWAGSIYDPNERITKVVFDGSFKDYKPATTKGWSYYCTKLETVEGSSNLNTDLTTGMNCMFMGCSALISLDLSSFNTEIVTSMYAMFDGCSALTTIYCNDDWKSSVVNESKDMFSGCSNLKGAVAYDVSKVDVSMANPTTGYFTKKTGTGITAPSVDVPLMKQGIYNLQGVKMQGSLEQLPAGIYIVNGRKVVKQ